MNRRMRRIRTVLLLSAAASIALLMVGAQAADVLRSADLSSVDMRFSVRGPESRPVVVVSVEATSITAPCRRRLRAGRWIVSGTRRSRALNKAGAQVIAYDVQFTETSGDDEADNALVEAVRAAGAPPVVLATTEVGGDGRTSIFGGGELEYSKASPANGNYATTSTGGSAGWRSRSTA